MGLADGRGLKLLGQELAGPRPGHFRRGAVVALRHIAVHKGVVRAGVGVEAMGLAQARQFVVQLAHIVLGWVGVNFAEVEQHRAVDAVGQLEGGHIPGAPGHHYVAAVEWHRGLEVRVGAGGQPDHPPAHAEIR